MYQGCARLCVEDSVIGGLRWRLLTICVRVIEGHFSLQPISSVIFSGPSAVSFKYPYIMNCNPFKSQPVRSNRALSPVQTDTVRKFVNDHKIKLM